MAFSPGQTAKSEFHAHDREETILVPTMNGLCEDSAYYAQLADETVAVELGLGHGDMRFGIISPPREKFADFVATMKPTIWEKINTALEYRAVQVHLPKSEVETPEFSLYDFFADDYGLRDALERGDYSAMVEPGKDKPALTVNGIAHQAFVATDEIGIEASAATSIDLWDTLPERIEELNADHPFLYYIRDVPTRSILFVGWVVDP
jgi:serpin B